jgi:hypothetical protein
MSLEHSLTKSVSPYKPVTDPNPLNVVFLPIMVNGNSKYVTTAIDDTDNEIHVENMVDYSEEIIIVDSTEKPSVSSSIFDIGKNPVTSFYIGSVTAVGLYILFCLLRKSK